MNVNSKFEWEPKLLISTAGGRFPRAWLEPPCASHYGVSRLMGLHYRSSHRRPFAIPAGVAAFRSNQRCSASKLRSEEHTSELQSRGHLVCRLLLENKKTPT